MLLRFEREAKVLASLNHPNISSIHGLEESNNLMELVEGTTLAERIARGRFRWRKRCQLLSRVCEGLEYAHERGIVHRHLKPANVKLTPAGQAKILDFSLAKGLDSAEAASADPASSPSANRGYCLRATFC